MQYSSLHYRKGKEVGVGPYGHGVEGGDPLLTLINVDC